MYLQQLFISPFDSWCIIHNWHLATSLSLRHILPLTTGFPSPMNWPMRGLVAGNWPIRRQETCQVTISLCRCISDTFQTTSFFGQDNAIGLMININVPDFIKVKRFRCGVYHFIHWRWISDRFSKYSQKFMNMLVAADDAKYLEVLHLKLSC